MDDRARQLLKTLVERYIADGQPVGSRTLSKYSRLDISPATIRNVMSDLEDLGLIASPHASAGRIPTPMGYRVFVDTLITVQPLDEVQAGQIQGEVVGADRRRIMTRAATVLSRLSSFAGIVATPRRSATFRQLEFLRLSGHRLLMIIVTPEGDVQNRILQVEREYTQNELTEAANWLNAHCAGQDFGQARTRLRNELDQIRGSISSLMDRAMEEGARESDEDQEAMLISGERNLVNVPDFSANMTRLRELFGVFEQRTDLMRLLEASSRASGVQIFIGGESALVPMEDLSVVVAPYELDGRVVGTLGVIGPTRMAYERMIPIVDITARLVSGALNRMRD